LIVDRGSRELDVKNELEQICSLARRVGGYHYVGYCFLEVLPPFIAEGISLCVESSASCITVMPYFLYPGMKLREAVRQTARIARDKNLKLGITKPLSYHPRMAELIVHRIKWLKKNNGIYYFDKECDVMLIGHGSSDRNAHDAFVYVANIIKPSYRNVNFCFLELDRPNIEEGIQQALGQNPKVLLLIPYFLHKGAHIKRDVVREVNVALEKYNFKQAFLGTHLGVDHNLVDIMIERAKEVEKRLGI
jgi:sirohydrochlorin ferrochelatase